MRYFKALLLFPVYKGGHFGVLRPPTGLCYNAEILKEKINYNVAASLLLNDFKE